MLKRTAPFLAPRAPRNTHHHCPDRGFVMMDVLMAILLFSVGVLALVALQAALTRSQTESKVRADASYLASEAIGLLWSDANQLSHYTSAGCVSLPRCKEWQDRVTASLPQGSGTVEADATTGDVKVTVSWTTPSGETHKYVTQTTVTKAGG